MNRSWWRELWFPCVVFGVIVTLQIVFVAAAGNDIPFHDQWDVEGRWLYPGWLDGTLRGADFFKAHNEHRILWTHLLNLGLFVANGQWDPLLQLMAIAVLRAACGAFLFWCVARQLSRRGRLILAAVLALAYLPHLAWHGVLWGFESQVYFSLGFSLVAASLLTREELSLPHAAAGVVVGTLALFAMASSAILPLAFLGLVGVRWLERREWTRSNLRLLVAAALLLLLALLLRVEVPEHAPLRAGDAERYVAVAAHFLAWPHVRVPLACLALNLPIVLLVLSRMLRWRAARLNEDFVLVVGGWSLTLSLATALTRGGNAELLRFIPSRYVDFVMLLPLANAWCACALAVSAVQRWKFLGRAVTVAWAAFLVVGWVGLSAEVMRWPVGSRLWDREATVRLLREFLAKRDLSIYDGQPRLIIPHPNFHVVLTVLADSRLRGGLPPSLQPKSPMGPLSRGTRALLGHEERVGR